MQDGQRNGDYGNADSPASSENRQVEGNPGNGSPFGRILNGIPSTPNKQVRGGGGIRDCFPTTISKIIAVVCVFCVIGASGSAADRADESERLLTDCATVIESKVNSMDSQLKEKDKQIAAAKEETQKAKKELEETKKSLDEANAKITELQSSSSNRQSENQQSDSQEAQQNSQQQTNDAPNAQEQTQQSAQDMSRIVYITPSGKKYHTSESCRMLSRSKTVTPISVGDAQAKGLTPCNVCGG